MRKSTRALLPTVLLALTAFGSNIPDSHAKGSSEFGPAVDAACQAFNGTTPFADQSCALCHTSSFGDPVEPEWSWWSSGNLTAFCPEPTNQAPNGVIDDPAGNLTILTGDSVTFMGTGSDPDGNLPLSFDWNFGGGAANSNVEDPGSVAFNSVGTFTVTFTVTDSLGLSDSTPASRRITVNDTSPSCTDADNDGFAVEGGSCGLVDCDDANAAINPGALEICTDGIDNNCNTLIDTADPDCSVSEACLDDDNDMFSPEGGICGPIDCDDSNAVVNPGAAEACGDSIDNDCDGAIDGNDSECNGGDCLGQFFDRDTVVYITEAEWDEEDSELEVEGDEGPSGAVVKISNANTGELLGTTIVESSGEWEFEISNIDPVPCRVRVEINGQFAERDVEDAPDDCDGGGTSNDVHITKAKWDDGKLKVKGDQAPSRALVTISNAMTEDLLGTTVAEDEGKWEIEVKKPVPVPCRVRVEINGQFGERDVEDAPTNCR